MNKAHSRPLAGNCGGFGVGENFAMCCLESGATNKEIAQMLFDAWKKSPLHNENMLYEEYNQGALGIKIVLQNGVPAVYASSDFSTSTDYQNEVATIEEIHKRIQIGAQVPGNIESAEEYYRKYYDLEVPEFANEYTSEVSLGLEVLDENGNKFQLPNGVEWEYARTDFRTYEGIWAPDGNVYTLSDGMVNFVTSDGHVYSIYVYPETVDDGYSASAMVFTNNYSGNTIVLKKSAYYTLDMMFPEGHDDMATNDCYYILNGETVVISF